MLGCEIWAILAQWDNAFIEYSVLHIKFLTFSYSEIQKIECSNGNKACQLYIVLLSLVMTKIFSLNI